MLKVICNQIHRRLTYYRNFDNFEDCSLVFKFEWIWVEYLTQKFESERMVFNNSVAFSPSPRRKGHGQCQSCGAEGMRWSKQWTPQLAQILLLLLLFVWISQSRSVEARRWRDLSWASPALALAHCPLPSRPSPTPPRIRSTHLLRSPSLVQPSDVLLTWVLLESLISSTFGFNSFSTTWIMEISNPSLGVL